MHGGSYNQRKKAVGMKKKVNRCRGCEHCRTGIVSPDARLNFESEEELEDFWARHSIGKNAQPGFALSDRGQRQLEDSSRRLKERKLRITMMIDPWLKQNLEELARPLGLGYQTLAHVYLAERVISELNAQRGAAASDRSSSPSQDSRSA
jgi:hypothetical protein